MVYEESEGGEEMDSLTYIRVPRDDGDEGSQSSRYGTTWMPCLRNSHAFCEDSWCWGETEWQGLELVMASKGLKTQILFPVLRMNWDASVSILQVQGCNPVSGLEEREDESQ